MKDERGIVLPLSVVFLVSFLLMMVFIFDLSRVLILRHELQGIADSLSLAGASATKVNPIYGHDPDLGSVVTGYHLVLDPFVAEREVQSAFNNNYQIIKKIRDRGDQVTDWSSSIMEEKKISVTVFGEARTVLMGNVFRLLGKETHDYDRIPIKVKSKSAIRQN